MITKSCSMVYSKANMEEGAEGDKNLMRRVTVVLEVESETMSSGCSFWNWCPAHVVLKGFTGRDIREQMDNCGWVDK